MVWASYRLGYLRSGFRAVDACSDILAIARCILPRAASGDTVVTVQSTIEIDELWCPGCRPQLASRVTRAWSGRTHDAVVGENPSCVDTVQRCSGSVAVEASTRDAASLYSH
jgi:hypothetical protein